VDTGLLVGHFVPRIREGISIWRGEGTRGAIVGLFVPSIRDGISIGARVGVSKTGLVGFTPTAGLVVPRMSVGISIIVGDGGSAAGTFVGNLVP